MSPGDGGTVNRPGRSDRGTAPALEAAELIDMRHLQPQDLAPLAGLPRLKAVTPGLGSLRKNEAAAALLGLPPVSGPYDWRQPEFIREG